MNTNKNKESKAQVFYRIVKAVSPHQFSGLYAVEKVYVRNNEIYKKEIVHEWDRRDFSEAALARFGGSTAYDAYIEDNELKEIQLEKDRVEVKSRSPEEVKAALLKEQADGRAKLD